MILLYPDGQRKEVILAGVPAVGDTIKLRRDSPTLNVEHVLWMEGGNNGQEPIALVSVRPSRP